MAAHAERAQTSVESFLSALPGPVAAFTQALVAPFTELLMTVSGDPYELIGAARTWEEEAVHVSGVRAAHVREVALLRAEWTEGEDADAFFDAMARVDKALGDLQEALDGTKELLVQAANAAVEAFNLLVELIVELLVWWATDLILALALTVVTYGASWLAAGAKALAEAVAGMTRAIRIVEKLAEILLKIERFLKKIAEIAAAYRKLIMELHVANKEYGLWKKAAYTTEALAFKAGRAVVLTPGRLAFNAVSPVDLPGLGHVSKDAYQGHEDLKD